MHNSAQLRCFENGNDDFGVEAFWIGDAARVGYFVPLSGPLNGHPPSIVQWQPTGGSRLSSSFVSDIPITYFISFNSRV